MFSETDDTIINYHIGSGYQHPGLYFPYKLKQQFSNYILISAFTTIRSNCEEACAQKLLLDMNDEEKQEIRDNSKISQIHLKSRKDSTQMGFDSCLRRCFVKRNTEHFGKDIQDYIYATAFEYQQDDFDYLDMNPIYKEKRNKKLSFPQSDYIIADKLIEQYKI